MAAFDPTKDTAIENLHTFLLGSVKYAWHSTHSIWKETGPQKAMYPLRLQAIDTAGLSLPAIRGNYIMQYANSLVGRQLKQVVQTGLFCLHDLIDAKQFAVWRAIGELLPLVWYTEIDDLEQYIVRWYSCLQLRISLIM
jgi:hypothetical protein